MNKIKINNIEISVEEFKRLAKENEALLKEPEVKGRYFFLKAELALKKQQAIVRCWKWQQENAPFEPDWGNHEQDKYYCNFDHERNELYMGYCRFLQEQFTLPYFKSVEDRDAFIEANKEDLLLLFTK